METTVTKAVDIYLFGMRAVAVSQRLDATLEWAAEEFGMSTKI